MTVGAMDLPPEGMLLGGVVLAADPARGTPATAGLSLLFTVAGVTVQAQSPPAERLLPWAGLDGATCHEQAEAAEGGTAKVLVLTSAGQSVRFLLPPETVSPGQAAFLDQAMPAWLARYRSEPFPSPPSPPSPPPGSATSLDLVPQGTPPKRSWRERKAAKAERSAQSPFDAPLPEGLVVPPGAVDPARPVEGETSAKKATNRRTLVLLIILLLVVIAAGAYYFVKKRNSHLTGTASVTSTISPTVAAGRTRAADRALAQSINLRLSDLPSGWTAVTGASTSVLPAATPAAKAAAAQAVSTFAGCLGIPLSTAAQLFASSPQADVVATATSPVFQSPAGSTVEMQSNTNVVRTVADATADAAPFAEASFPHCFQTYSTSVAAGAVPGTTAAVAPVRLPSPPGVTAYGYLTTFTIPHLGTRVEGDAFIVGGRIETTLVPSTGGVPVPSAAFSQAYDAIVSRVAADRSK